MTEFDLKTLNLADGTHSITVIAKASGYKDSEPSNAVSYVVGSEEPETLSAGLYDANDNLIASWDSLVNDYGMDCTIDYSDYSSGTNYYKKTTTSPYYVLTNNSELANGVKLMVGKVNRLGNCAFRFCKSLTSVTILNGATSIGNYAFTGCESLTSIEIPNSVTYMGYSILGLCYYLKRIDFSTNTSIPTIQSGTLDNTNITNFQIKVPENLIDSWKNETNWSVYADKIVTEFTNEV